jgi:spermidine synthase
MIGCLNHAVPFADPDPRRSTYLGLFFVALATLMYEILLTRIFSVTMLYHFAFVALSVAMFGMTAGALFVYLAPRLFPPARLHARLAAAAVAFPASLVLSFMTQLSIPFRLHASVIAIYAVMFTYAVIAVPFVVSGIVVCLALTGFPRTVSRLYAADLAGAAAGCILLIAAIGWSDGPTAVLWVAFLASLGGIAFSRSVPSPRVRRLALVGAAVIGTAAAGHTMLVWKGRPVFRILYTKASTAVEPLPLYDKWNSHSRVRVTGNPDRESPAQGWGLSPTLPPTRLHQLQLDIDVWAGTVMTRFDGNLSTVEHLKYDVTNIVYYLRRQHAALVIGAGGGRDVLSALAFGARSVTAVDINKDIIRTVNGRFGDFTGHLDRDPRVRFVNDEARSFVARSTERFGTIQISLIDTWAATAAGAFVLGENSLYTVEAWTTFLSHLSDDGVLSVSRWYFQERPAEMYRTTTLAVAALQAIGVTEPRRHIAIVRNMRPALAWVPDSPDGVGTMLVSRRPFTASELDTLDAEAARLLFDVPFSPRTSLDPTFVRLADPEGFEEFVAGYPVNIAPPTDDSPFFFNMLRLRDFARPSLLEFGNLSHNMKAVATLGVLLLTVLLLTTLCIVLPLWATRDRIQLTGAGPLFGFFIAIGLGFMLIETSQMQRLIIALGHPTYGLSVVLFAMLLSSGLGSYLTSGVDAARSSAAGRTRLVLLVLVLAAFGLITPVVARWSESMTTPARIAAAVLLLFPAGVFMGMAFPLGMKLASTRTRELTPWLWGLNGAASVLASVLSVCIALTWSISTAFWTGWACYLAALGTFIAVSRRPA